MTDILKFWNSFYENKTTPWDLASYAEPFKTYLDSPYCIKSGHVGVIGCGNGHECDLLIDYNFTVTGIDFANQAIQNTQNKFKNKGVLNERGFTLQEDFFKLDLENYFDVILEHTFFCAINPKLRYDYVRKIVQMLKPDGYLIALWWIMDKEDGPPYGVTQSQIFKYFAKNFNIELAYVPNNSHKTRFNSELFTVMRLTDKTI